MPVDHAFQPRQGNQGSKRIDVLFVDLDNTLVATDTFVESLLLALRQEPLLFLVFPLWLTRGLAAAKRRVAQRVMVDANRLPYRAPLLEYLAEQRSNGVRLVLATASDAIVASNVAAYVGIFDDVLASDGITNVKSTRKLASIEAYCKSHRLTSFAYAGDSRADLAIWRAADQAVVVGSSAAVLRQVRKLNKPMHVIPQQSNRFAAIVKTLRPKQWVKNVLVFADLLLAHQLASADRWIAALLAFVCFSLCASATYVINDLLDIAADRSHPEKHKRPLASGAFPLAWAPPLGVGLFLMGIALAAYRLPAMFTGCLVVYIVTTLLYSFWLKAKVMIDVTVLAGLYTLRILAGGLAVEIPTSEWMMALSLFLFTSLAFGKRYCELLELSSREGELSRGRGYTINDLSLIEVLGPASGYLAVLVLALYIHGDVAGVLYPRRQLLWLTCPLLMYWIGRYWIMAKRRMINDDPITFAFRDSVSRVIGILVGMIAVAAAWPR